jgi:hypothetical protein
MSHKWTANAVERISVACMKEVKDKMKIYPWLISYDNVNIPFRVFSQRLDNQGEFGNGTAATVYIKPNARLLSEGLNQELKNTRNAGIKTPLTELDIMDLGATAFPHVTEFEEYHILRVLLDSPDFDLQTYDGKDSIQFEPPTPIRQLPVGPENVGLQYLLGTVNIPESSYEGNSNLIEEWFKQLGWASPGEKMKVAMSKIVSWIGDQLTVDRLRGLFKYRAEDNNSFERLDFSVFNFGWFHLQMAFAVSLHKQYEGTSKTRGLKQAFEILEKKGLAKAQTKGVFHHDLNEALHHVAEAHIREDWKDITHVDNLADLRQKTPAELRSLATKILEQRASSQAIDKMDARPKEQQDDEMRQIIMWNRDILQYVILGQAIQSGDIGLMEDMLVTLLFRFSGGGNGKYAVEVLELLQNLHREYPAELRYIIRVNVRIRNKYSQFTQGFCTRALLVN